MNIDMTYSFSLPTKVLYGINSLNLAGTEAKKLGAGKVLVVTDQDLWKIGLADNLVKNLKETGLEYEVFFDVPEDPNTQVIDRGVHFLKETGCQVVVIIGGGSALCAGKGIALVAANGGRITDYEGVEKFSNAPLPVIAIPTTAGSGSEVSPSFIISDETRNSYKMSINGYRCFPRAAILDPMIIKTLPPRQFIISGVDALVHAVEAACTKLATPLTDAIAMEAIQLIMGNLAKAAYTDDLEAKGNQLLASTMANIACGNAKLGLVHAMTTPMGHYHLAHGLVNGILLPYVMAYNLPVCADKFARMAEGIGAVKRDMTRMEKAAAAIDSVKELFTALDFPDRFPADIVPRAEIPSLASLTMGVGLTKMNLRKPSEAEIVEIYERAFDGWKGKVRIGC